tara:strand:+ start:1453 stop:1896 length:444 start_codon:yes stop_codon:yes gene_type:complete
MAINKFEKTNTEKQELDLTEEGKHLKALYEKIDESLDKTNDHINKVASMQSEINTEKNKDGITTAQANAIVANTAKVGMTTKQATQLTLAVQSMIQLTSAVKKTTVAMPTLTLVAGTKAGTYSLRLAVRISVNEGKAQVKYIDLPLT